MSDACLWKVDRRLDVGKRGCDGKIVALSEVEGADYCTGCNNMLLNVTEHTDLLPEGPKTHEYEQLLEELLKTYEAKNADYGDSFSRVFKKRGMLSAIISLEHKMNRLETLTENKNRVNESMRDTLIDMAGYCLMTVMELDKDEDSIRAAIQKEADFIREADERELW